jgi:MFS family permease
MGDAKRVWDVLPPLAGSALAASGSGLLHTLLPLRLLQLGYVPSDIGWVATAYSAGFLAGCMGTAVLIRSVGHVRAYGAFAAVAALTILAFDVFPPLPVMIALFVCTGIASSGLSVVTESWLSELSAPAWRGRLLTAYVLLLAGFYGLGQLMALGLDASGSRMLMIAAGCYVTALIPVSAIDVVSPTPPQTVRLDLTTAFRVSPVGAMSCLYTGLISSTFGSIGPLYATALGLRQPGMVLLMAAVQIGGLALQWPLGILSDRLDRRWVLVGMSLGAVAIAAAFIGLEPLTNLPLLLAMCAIFGGIAESFYPVGVAQANDRAEPDQYVPVSSNLLLLWGAGGAIGPILSTAALQRIGAGGFFWYMLVISACFTVFTVWRIWMVTRREGESCEEFVPYPNPPTSPALFEWVPFKKLRDGDKS